MASFTHDEVVQATGATPSLPSGPGFTEVFTDSRRAAPGQLFVALRGDAFDGHRFVADCASAGVTGAVVAAEAVLEGIPPTFTLYRVSDTLAALGGLARFHRLRFGIPVGAVGGSNGKTTTKEMAAAIVGLRAPALATLGNFNNEVGVPLTLFRLDATHRSAIIELGMNHAGEVERLTDIARPQAGVVTVVQPEHLEGLGSLEGVAHAEGELYRGLPHNGIAVANLDDALAFAEAKSSGRTLLTFGRAAGADVRLLGVDQHDADGMRFRIGHEGRVLDARVAHVGEHNAMNACAAFALARALGFPVEQCLEGLAQALPVNRRLNLRTLPGDVLLIDDCYNANPGSMGAALQTLTALAKGHGRRVAVLGDMLELGPEEAEAHRQLGDDAAAGADLQLFFGPRSQAGAAAARAKGLTPLHTEDAAHAVSLLQGVLKPGDRVLIKGSRGMRMERIVAGLLGDAAPPSGH
jgi:UDP-N-acetylmuramoyl-tripeptide--D-alanyl-D-alanine ligase